MGNSDILIKPLFYFGLLSWEIIMLSCKVSQIVCFCIFLRKNIVILRPIVNIHETLKMII